MTNPLKAGIKIRPFARQVLAKLSESFEIVIFTASHSSYANKVINMLDPDGSIIKFRMFRDHCIQTKEGVHVKDLRIIRNRKLENIIIVDNSLYCFGFQLANGIPILPYYDDPEDEELLELELFLMKLKNIKKVQIFIQTFFCYKKYVEHAESQMTLVGELVESIPRIVGLYNKDNSPP